MKDISRLLVDEDQSAYLKHIHEVAEGDADGLVNAAESYGNSWKQRGGIGAFMMLARKWDRLEHRVSRPASHAGNISGSNYDIFAHFACDERAEGIVDDIRDLRRYLLLVEAEMRARGYEAKHRDNKEGDIGSA